MSPKLLTFAALVVVGSPTVASGAEDEAPEPNEGTAQGEDDPALVAEATAASEDSSEASEGIGAAHSALGKKCVPREEPWSLRGVGPTDCRSAAFRNRACSTKWKPGATSYGYTFVDDPRLKYDYCIVYCELCR